MIQSFHQANTARHRLRGIGLLAFVLGWLFWLPTSFSGIAQTAETARANTVYVASLTGAIGPATSAYIERAIVQAEARNATALIIEMDTPGGLDTAMRDINQAILSSQVPVIVYVHPPGSRAASAGAYILYASHLSAMAPGTSIGAATPVQLGGGPSGDSPANPEAEPQDGAQAIEDAAAPMREADPEAPDNAQAMRNKAVNDAVAYIQSLAELRDRNADWAENAVRDAISVTASEALELGVIEILATSVDDLLAQANGRFVTVQDGQVLELETGSAEITQLDKTLSEEVLSVITDPNIAFLLVNLGFIGLLVSFYNGLEPITAVAGVICLIVGFYALNTLPVNYAGAALIILGLALLISEAFFASAGLLALGGIAAFVLGALMLVDSPSPEFQLDWRLILLTAAAMGGLSFALVSYGLAAQARKVTTGSRGLVGMHGTVLEWSGKSGFVQVDGERWRAVSKSEHAAGDEIVVVKVSGLTLSVKAA